MNDKINIGCTCGCSSQPISLNVEKEPVDKDKVQENWYLPYMDKKTKGIEVEEKPSPVAVFYCAGASNVGQASMLASVLAANKVGYDKAALLCLASISAGLKNIHNGAKNARGIVSIDGCPMECARKTLNKDNFEPQSSIVLTRDLGVNKNFDLNSGEDVDRMADYIAEKITEVFNS